ncbi:protein of unknown function [Nitrospira japonica]|uniref:Uncharacterized protein n=1 Tax=Nitrospira japonica TaxID=1325564 RepID=A0A1W1I0T8_9BACT|nr:protein of unknown function [Nitrospira japonica]
MSFDGANRLLLDLGCLHKTSKYNTPGKTGGIAKALESRWGHQSLCTTHQELKQYLETHLWVQRH